MFRIYLIQTAGVVIAVEALRRSGAHPGSLFMAFLFNYLYRILTLRYVLRAVAGREPQAWARFITRAPGVADKNEPIREGSETGPPAPIYAYILTVVMTGVFGFILTHSASSDRLDVTFIQGMGELLVAAALAIIWWLQDLGNGALVADLRRGLTYNLGFNSHDASISAMTVLTGCAILVAAEGMGFSRNPWMTIGPLLFYKWVWGVWADKKHLLASRAV